MNRDYHCRECLIVMSEQMYKKESFIDTLIKLFKYSELKNKLILTYIYMHLNNIDVNIININI